MDFGEGDVWLQSLAKGRRLQILHVNTRKGYRSVLPLSVAA